MVVSHSLVSWVQVLGLVMGLFGSFYLEVAIFGEKNMPWLSALLPAFGVALGLLLVYSSNALDQLLFHDLLHATVPLSYLWLFGGLIVAQYYWFAAQLAKRHTRGDASGKSWFWRRILPEMDTLAHLDRKALGCFALVAAFWVVVTIGVTTFLYLSGEHTSERLTTALHIGGGVVVVIAGEMALFAGAQISDPEQLKKVGFILSALALLTQFIPPVLDLLNISVK